MVEGVGIRQRKGERVLWWELSVTFCDVARGIKQTWDQIFFLSFSDSDLESSLASLRLSSFNCKFPQPHRVVQWIKWNSLVLSALNKNNVINNNNEIKSCLLLGRKPMTNLDSILKSRDITLLTVKAMIFPVVMYGCESWTIKKAERRRINAFESCWRRPGESLGQQGDQTNQS